MKVRLVSVSTWAQKPRITVGRLPAMVGRSSEAEVQLTDCWTSRRHCLIDQVNGTVVVRDVGSKHGTFVNGERVAQAHLLPGDRLTVGINSFAVDYRRRTNR